MRTRFRAGLIVAAATMLCASCGDTGSNSTQELDAEVVDDIREDTGPAGDSASAMFVPATDELLSAFRIALNRWSHIEADTPADVHQMVGRIDLVVIAGVLGPTGPGRKIYHQADIYSSRANLQIRDMEILKGTLPEPSGNAYVEVPWPNNVELTELVSTTPVGARVIIVGVSADKEAPHMLRGDKANLLIAAPYGLLIEALDGRTYTPIWDLGRPLVRSGGEALTKFEDALYAIREAAKR